MPSTFEGKNIILEAARFAADKHAGQLRDDGEDYINHPMRVANNLILRTNVDDFVIAAAWLHDVIEDCDSFQKEISKKFGFLVSGLVWEVTNKFTKESYPNNNRKERHLMEIGRISTISFNAKLIKLFDRYDNTVTSSQREAYYVEETKKLLSAIGEIHPIYHEIENWCQN